MKKIVAVILTILMIFSFSFISSYAVSESIKVTLLTPYERTLPYSDGKVDSTALGEYFGKIMQSTVDSIILDNPYNTFWIDFSKSVSTYKYSYIEHGSTADIEVTDLVFKLESYSEATDPKGMAQMMDDKINEFTPSGTTMYDYVKSIHDYVCSITVYDKSENIPDLSYHCFGAFVNGKAVCQGYSEAFKILCDKYGIPCILVSGTGKSGSDFENHMWCYVRMDDGKWYATDVTWDDGNTIGYTFFLVGSDTICFKYKFSESHISNGDVSRSGLIVFDYPELSKTKYEQTEKPFTPNKDNAENSWFYNQIDDAETKNVYDKIKGVVFPSGSIKYVVTTEKVTTQEITTKKKKTTKGETTKPDTTDELTSLTEKEAESDFLTDAITSMVEIQSDSTVTDEIKTALGSVTISHPESVTEKITQKEAQTDEAESFAFRVFQIIIIVSSILLLAIFSVIIIVKVTKSENK